MNPNWQVMRELDRLSLTQQRPVRRHGYVVDGQGQPGYISPANVQMNHNNVHRNSGRGDIYGTYVPPVQHAQPTYGQIQHLHQMQPQNGHYYQESTYGHIGMSHQNGIGNGIYGRTAYGQVGQTRVIHQVQVPQMNGVDRRTTYHYPVNQQQQPLM
jgi:hypothetical protein